MQGRGDVSSNSNNWYGGNTITKQCLTTSSEFELQFHFEMTIVSNCMSHHLKEFKLHFNYFPILDTTVTKLTTILHLNRLLVCTPTPGKIWCCLALQNLVNQCLCTTCMQPQGIHVFNLWGIKWLRWCWVQLLAARPHNNLSKNDWIMTCYPSKATISLLGPTYTTSLAQMYCNMPRSSKSLTEHAVLICNDLANYLPTQPSIISWKIKTAKQL